MKYFSQRRYSYIPYPQLMDFPDDPYGKSATVRSGGCGLCSACMMVDQLTMQPFSVRECAQLSMDCGANHDDGTDMEIFGPVLAKKFNLEYYPTNDVALAAEELRNGGRVILLVGGDREGHKGVFSTGGHFVVIISTTEDEFCILDPNCYTNKYTEAEKKGLVRQDGYFIYASHRVVDEDRGNTRGRHSYYVFKRKQAKEAK